VSRKYLVTAVTSGWQVLIAGGTQGTTSTSSQTGGAVSGTVTFAVTMFAPAGTATGTVGTATVVRTNGPAPYLTTTLTATVTTVTNSGGVLGYSLYCFGVTPSTQTIPAGSTISFKCGMTGLASISLGALQLLGLGLTVNTAGASGWVITANGAQVNSGVSISVSTVAQATLLSNGAFPVSIAVPCSATAGTTNVTVTATLSVAGIAGLTNFVSTVPTTVTAATIQTPSVSASAVDFGSTTWNGSAYGSLPQSVTVGLTVPDTGCVASQWKVQTSVSAMSRTGGGGSIPATAVSYLSGSTTAGNVSAIGSPGSLATARTVATGSNASTSGNLTLNLSLSPPNTAPIGTYTGTITFTTSTGP
jgi:hypothetical protein